MKQVDQDRIIDSRIIYLLKPFHALDHVHPEMIIEEKIWVHVPPLLILNDSPIIGFILVDHPEVGVPGYL